MLRHSVCSLAVLVALSACSGGGSAVSSLPSVPASPGTASSLQRITLSVKIPAAASGTATANHRRPLYVSTATQSAVIAVNGGTPVIVNLAANSANCVAVAGGRTCSASVSAPVGVDTFAESLFASTDGSGTALSRNTTTATIVAGKANVVSLTLDGVVAGITLTLANASPTVGTASTIGLTVSALDASGATIIGNDPFANPIALTDSDTSKVTTLSASTVNTPADVVTVAYTGATLASATFTATATGVAAATATLSPTTVAGFNDYTTFGYDNARDAFNPNSTAITPSNLPHLAWQSSVGDFNTQTQPILSTHVPGHAGTLFVGGGSGSVYAVDARSGSTIWHTFTTEMSYDQCGDGVRYFGIGGSAAYDPSTNMLYIVGNGNSALDAYPANILYQINANTGNIAGQVNFANAALGPTEMNFGHTSVALNNGIAYVGTGTTCDISSWRGRVAAINVTSMTLKSTFYTVWDANNNWGGGGVWGWGGVTIDRNGNVLTGVGNADDGADGLPNDPIQSPFVAAPEEYSGLGETLLELSSDLSTPLASNHPIPLGTYNAQANDLDVQGTPLSFVPNGTGCGAMVAIQAKSGALNLYNENQIGNGPVATFQLSPSSANDAYLGDPAYSPATGLVYAPVASSVSPTLDPPGLIAINPGCGNPSVTWHAAFGQDSSSPEIPRSVPGVSAGGVVFDASVNGSGSDIWALNASTGAILNGGNPILHTSAYVREPPTIDGLWVYFIDNNGDLYGMTVDSQYASIAARARSVDPRSLKTGPVHH